MGISLLDPLFSETGSVVTPNDLFADEGAERIPDDIAAAGTGGAPAQAPGQQDPGAPIPGGGALLEEPSAAKVFKITDRDVERQDRLAKNRDEEGKHWDRIKRGVQFSLLEKSEDQSVYRAVLPPGVDDTQQPIPNKVLDLCSKQVSQILVDPPLPNPKPDGDNERNRGAMDLAKRFLRADGDASGTNDSELWREVLTLNRTRKSGFVYVWVDPTAGGWRPKQKKAHPRATDPAQPLEAPELDPQSGQPVTDANGQPVMERTTDPVLRYVAEVPDPTTGETREVFTEHAAEAAREWLPKHRRKVLSPNQVRTLPASATVRDAHSIILLMWEPLADARRRFPLLRTMNDAQLKALTSWKPKRWKSIVPEAVRPKESMGGEVSDDTLLFWYHRFCRISLDYPDGAEIAVTGGTTGDGAQAPGVILCRDTLREDVEQDDGTTVPVLMEPPVAQFRALVDTDTGDPMGGTPVSLYGGANEIRAHLYLSVLEDIDVRLHPNTFLTSQSPVTREDINRRDGTPLVVLTKDDMPIFEQRPPLPSAVPSMLERIEHDMDTLANLNQTAQALDSSYSQSGEAKKVAISQAKVQLAQDWQGFIDGVLQYWKVKLQLAQARLKTPQLVRIAGEDRAYQSSHFVGADLVGVSAVALLPGSGTMMSPAEKSQYLAQFQNQQWLAPDDAGELARSSMSDDLGLPPSPHEEHIDRCIADWLEGPPEGWVEAQQANDALPQRQQAYAQQAQALVQQTVQLLTGRGMDPQAAQTAAAAHAQQQLGPPPQATTLPTPFEDRANDEEPTVAHIQAQKLSRLMSTVEYARQPLEWRKLVDAKYSTAAPAAGIQTVREAQEQQQQAAQAAVAAKGSGADPNAPPAYQQFIATIQQKVVAMAEQLLAREIAAIGASTSVQQKPLPQPTLATIGDDGTSPAGAAPVPAPADDAAQQANDASEADANRAHDVVLAEQKHGHAMQQIAAKAVGAKLAKADRAADRQAERPLPLKDNPNA